MTSLDVSKLPMHVFTKHGLDARAKLLGPMVLGPLMGLFISIVAACGCPHEPGPLATPDEWMQVAADADPFSDRLAQVDCEGGAFGPEDFGGERAFSVDTADCNYITITQPAARSVCAGEQLKVRLWHFELTGPPGEGHIALAVNEGIVWEQSVAIPSDSELLVPRFEVGDIIQGDPLHFHVHNHGANSYSLIEVTVDNE